MTKYIGGTPQQLDACFSLLLLQISHDFLQVGFVLFDSFGFCTQVYIVETIVSDTDFLHEFKTGIHLVLSSLNLVSRFVPWELLGTDTKLVTTFSAQCVPPSHRKLQPFSHGLTHDYLICIVVTESQRIAAFNTFILNLFDSWEKFFHRVMNYKF